MVDNGKKESKHHQSTVDKAKRVVAIVERYYEPGNHRRSYNMVWRMYVYPIYPCSLRRMKDYIKLVRELDESPQEEDVASLGPLFAIWDAERKAWTT